MGTKVGYHGLITLDRKSITTCDEFTNKLIEIFDKKDHTFHFRELSRLK